MTPPNENAALAGGANPRAHSDELKDDRTVTPPDAIRKDFARDFARSAFRQIDGDWFIVGKLGRISQFPDGLYDAWFVGPNLEPLTQMRCRRLFAYCDARYTPQGAHVALLTGEVVCTYIPTREFVLDMARLMQVKRHRHRELSPEARAALAERMRKVSAERVAVRTVKTGGKNPKTQSGSTINELTAEPPMESMASGVLP